MPQVWAGLPGRSADLQRGTLSRKGIGKSNGQAMAQRHGAVLQQAGNVAGLRLSRSPSNALPSEFCSDLSSLLSGVIQDPSLLGAVIASDLPMFTAG